MENTFNFEFNDFLNERKGLGKIINPILERYNLEKKEEIEVCQVGKFILKMGQEIEITEKPQPPAPDFIIKHKGKLIGLEHRIIVYQEAKKREGFIENIFCKAEEILNKDKELPNFLVNCDIKKDINFKLSKKNYLIDKVVEVVKEFVLNGKVIKNPLIEDIGKPQLQHTEKAVVPNFGGWTQKTITEELILSAIEKKEKKINSYKKDGVKTQWLLLVIGGIGESSYEMDKNLELDLKTDFDKVYILEDRNNCLHKLK